MPPIAAPQLKHVGRQLASTWARQPRPLAAWLDADEAIHPRRLAHALWPTRRRVQVLQATDLLRIATIAHRTDGDAVHVQALQRPGIVMVLGFERLTREQQLELGGLFRGGAIGDLSVSPGLRTVVLQQREAVEPELPFELAIRQFPAGTIRPDPNDPAWAPLLCLDTRMAAERLAAMEHRAQQQPDLAEVLPELPTLILGPGARRLTYPPAHGARSQTAPTITAQRSTVGADGASARAALQDGPIAPREGPRSGKDRTLARGMR